MAITFACPQCRHTLHIKEEFAGRRGKCPKCQATVQVPAAPPAEAVDEPVTAELALAQSAPAPAARHAGLAVSPAPPAARPSLPPTAPVRRAAPPPPSDSATLEEVLAGFRSAEIERLRLPLTYRLGVLLAAMFMVLLPLIYLALIAVVCFAVYWHLTTNFGIVGAVRGKAALMALVAYLAPVVIGGILIVFMFKPLFARPGRGGRKRSVTRESDPILFAFVDRICEVVRAPRPRRIDIDCDINASASLGTGWLGLFARGLTLTIGLPLVSGLSLQQFAGVLAHEFGHFSQGTGMRLTYVIRSINYWFIRVVYERDSWDEWLTSSASSLDLRIGWVLYLAMLFVWLTRKVLWLLMWVGHVVAGFLLRQMEFDADTYECRLAGSETFGTTCRQLRVLGFAWQGAQADLGMFFREGRLVDNLPRLIMANVQQMPDEVKDVITQQIEESRTGLMDSHPSDKDRVEAAQRLAAPGVFHTALPATVLFRDFDQSARNVTWDYYYDIFGSELKPTQLHPVDTLLVQQKQESASDACRQRFFAGLKVGLRPLQLPSIHLAAVSHLELAQKQLIAARQAMADCAPAYRDAYARFDDLDTQLVAARQALPLLRLNIRPANDGPWQFRNAAEAQHSRDSALANQRRLTETMAPFETAAGQRLYYALCLLQRPEIADAVPEAAALRQQCGKSLPVVGMVAAQLGSLLELRNGHAALNALFAHIEGRESNQDLIREIVDQAGRTREQLASLRPLFERMEYPFDHAEGPLTVAQYALQIVPPASEVGAVYEAGQEFLANVLTLYGRCLGRLCQAAEGVEATLELPPLNDVSAA